MQLCSSCARGCPRSLTPTLLLLQLSSPVPGGVTHPANGHPRISWCSISTTPATAGSAREVFRSCPVPGSCSDLDKAFGSVERWGLRALFDLGVF